MTLHQWLGFTFVMLGFVVLFFALFNFKVWKQARDRDRINGTPIEIERR